MKNNEIFKGFKGKNYPFQGQNFFTLNLNGSNGVFKER